MKKPITDWNKFRDQFVRWTLRRASFRWPPRGEAMKKARIGRGQYQCADCKGIFKNKEVKLDHIEPVIPANNTDMSGLRDPVPTVRPTSLNLGAFVLRMFPEVQGYQVLCGGCHDRKTARETTARAEAKRIARDRKTRGKG